MYAYVKILSGFHKTKKKIISTENLRSFKKDVHKKNIKYMMKSDDKDNHEDVPIVILLLADSQSELQKLIDDSKRLTFTPSKLLMTASEDDLLENLKINKIDNKKPKSLKDKELQDVVQNKISTFRKSSSNLTQMDSKKYLMDQSNLPSVSIKPSQELTSTLIEKNSSVRSGKFEKLLNQISVVDNSKDENTEPPPKKGKSLEKKVEHNKSVKVLSIEKVHSEAKCDVKIKQLEAEVEKLKESNSKLKIELDQETKERKSYKKGR